MALTELALLRGGLPAVKRPFSRNPLHDPREQHWVGLLLVAQEIDGHPWRTRLRNTFLETNPLLFGLYLGRSIADAGLVELPPSNTCLLAEIAGSTGLASDAVRLLQQAELRHPDDLQLCCSLAFFESLQPHPSWLAMEKWYRAALGLQPDSAVLRSDLGITCFHLKKDREALAHFQEATRLDPQSFQAWCNQGVIQQRLGKLTQARDSCLKALELQPQFRESLLNLACVLSDLGDVEEAEKYYAECIRLNPKDPQTHFNHAVLLTAVDPSRAREAYQLVLRLKEDKLEAHFNLALLLHDQGELLEALKHLERSHQLMKAVGYPRREDAATLIRNWKRQVEFDRQLPKLVRGEVPLETNQERLDAAQVAGLREEHPTAVRLYAAAFVEKEPSFDDRQQWLAACSAALAGCGEGRGTKLGETERSRLRGQALSWLQEDFEQVKRLLYGADAERGKGLARLRAWQRDPRLACVREKDRLASLPEPERIAWSAFWAEVDARRDTVQRALNKR